MNNDRLWSVLSTWEKRVWHRYVNNTQRWTDHWRSILVRMPFNSLNSRELLERLLSHLWKSPILNWRNRELIQVLWNPFLLIWTSVSTRLLTVVQENFRVKACLCYLESASKQSIFFSSKSSLATSHFIKIDTLFVYQMWRRWWTNFFKGEAAVNRGFIYDFWKDCAKVYLENIGVCEIPATCFHTRTIISSISSNFLLIFDQYEDG